MNVFPALLFLTILKSCSLNTILNVIRPPGTVVSECRMFDHSWCFLIRQMISELPWPIVTKLYHVISIRVDFIMQVQKFGALLEKFWGPETCKIWTDFTQLPTLIANVSATTQDIQNQKTNWSRFETDSCRVRRNKYGELWSTMQNVWHVSLNPPKSNISEDYISAPGSAGPWNFYTR